MRGVVDVGAVEQNQILVGRSAAHVQPNRKIGQRGDAGQGLDGANRIGFDRRRRRLQFSHLQGRAAGANVEAFDLFAIRLDHGVIELDRLLAEINIVENILFYDHYLLLKKSETDHRSDQSITTGRHAGDGVISTLIGDTAPVLIFEIDAGERQTLTVGGIANETADIGSLDAKG